MALTAATWSMVRLAERRRIEERFQAQAEMAAVRIRNRMLAHEQILLGAATLVSLKDSVTETEWKDYEHSLDLARLYPGIQGLGWIYWNPTAGLEGKGLLKYLAPPTERNLGVLGLDIYSEPSRRKAMDRARDTGKVAMTGKTILFSEKGAEVSPGTVLFAPVYRRGSRLETVKQRRSALMGWTSLPARMPDLLAGILGKDFPQIDLDLFDGSETSGSSQLFDSGLAGETQDHLSGLGFIIERKLEVGGRTWTARMWALPSFVDGMGGGHHVDILVSGVAISLLVLALLKSRAGAESRAEALAESRAKALIESEDRFRGTFEKATVGFYATTPDGRVLTANPALLGMLGYGSVEEIPNLNLDEPYAPGYSRAVFLERLEREGVLVGIEAEWRRKDGSPVFVRETSRVIQDTDGRILRYEGTVEDISEWKASTGKIREQESRLRALLDAIPDLFFVQDAEGVYLDYHASVTDLLAAPPEVFLGKRPGNVLPPELAHQFDSALALVVANRQKQSLEYDLVIGGAPHRFEANIVPFGPDRYLTVIRDITDRVKGEDALVRARKAESLGLMAGGIAHDFNNIFQALGNNLEIALSLAQDSREKTALHRAERNLARAANLALRMLEFSGRSFRRSESVDLNELVASVNLEENIPPGLRFEWKPQGGLPPVDGDPSQIRQVLGSLVSNALEAMGSRPGEIHLSTAFHLDGISAEEGHEAHWVQARPPGPVVRLSVADSGCGASRQVVERMFDPFYSTKAPGRGLGLAAVLGILKGHKAGLQVKSSPGKGSTFHIYFPAHLKERTTSGRWGHGLSKPSRRAVLFADDDEDLRQVVGEAIREVMGLQLFEARDGMEAVELFKQHGDVIGLVLLDATMPRMKGPEAFQQIRKLQPRVSGILISGYAEETTREVASRSGFQRAMKKPFTLKELKESVESVLGTGENPSSGPVGA